MTTLPRPDDTRFTTLSDPERREYRRSFNNPGEAFRREVEQERFDGIYVSQRPDDDVFEVYWTVLSDPHYKPGRKATRDEKTQFYQLKSYAKGHIKICGGFMYHVPNNGHGLLRAILRDEHVGELVARTHIRLNHANAATVLAELDPFFFKIDLEDCKKVLRRCRAPNCRPAPAIVSRHLAPHFHAC